MSTNPLLAFVERYGPPAGEGGPLLFVQEVLGVERVEPWQEEMLAVFGRGERRISIRSGNGTGKTAFVSWCIIYMLLFRFPQNTVATAPSKDQLEDALVVRVLEWFERLPEQIRGLYEVKKNRIELRAAPSMSWFSARTAREERPEALRGIHSANVLIVADEASGIPEPIFTAGQGAMSSRNAITILISNPTRTGGYFARTHNENKAHWCTRHVRPGESSQVDPQFRQDIINDWGEDSDEFRVMWLGEFPHQDMNTIISRESIEAAMKRDVILPPKLKEIWGIDVARFGNDRNVIVRRNRLAVSPKIEFWSGKDTMQTAGKIKALYDETPHDERPDEILVDEIGVGGGVVDRLREQLPNIRGINVSETASANDKYKNVRTELWFLCRDWLLTNTKKLPTCEGGCSRGCPHLALADELAMPRYGYTSSGKLLVEPKDQIKKRTRGKSPDFADALCLTFASEPASLLYGSGKDSSWSYDWNKPITRNLSHV